jgi:uncharacterized membrane-anchored protein
MNFRAYWSDPLWRALRVITIVTATATIVLLIGYLVGGRSWLGALIAAVIANVVVNLAFVIRSLVVRSRLRRKPHS